MNNAMFNSTAITNGFQGMQLALDAQPDWADQAWVAILQLAKQGIEFTSEDVLAITGLPSGEVGQHKNNASGAIMNKAARAGWIRKVGYGKAKRKESHGAVLAIWIGA
jgi:hypothetical protein